MSNQQLAKLLEVKALRVRKARVALMEAQQLTKDRRERAQVIKNRQAEKIKFAAAYAEKRFNELQSAGNVETFFTSFTIGLFRNRREIASLGLRIKRLDSDIAIALAAEKSAMQNFSRASRNEEQLIDVCDRLHKVAKEVNELEEEEDLQELVAGRANYD